MPDTCPLCQLDKEQMWFEDQAGFVLWDAFPISDAVFQHLGSGWMDLLVA